MEATENTNLSENSAQVPQNVLKRFCSPLIDFLSAWANPTGKSSSHFGKREDEGLFRIIFVLSLGLHFLLATIDGYSGDIQYWVNWATKLSGEGFANFTPDYPPAYLEWLWLIGNIYRFFDMPIYNDALFKMFYLGLNFITQIFLLYFVAKTNRVHGNGRWVFAGLLVLAFNPALILDGPVWGQVDLFPLLPVILAIHFGTQRRYAIWIPALMIAGLLCKFQMIVFLPIVAGLCLKQFRKSLIGLLPMIGVFLLMSLPFLIHGNLFKMIDSAYFKMAAVFPYATYNAANLWYVIGGNVSPDYVSIFSEGSTRATGFWDVLFTPRKLGMLLFSAYSLVSMIYVYFAREPRQIWAAATLSGLAFFTLLTGMHERYLVIAIPVAVIWSAYDSRALKWLLFITLLSFFNMHMIHRLRGEAFWQAMSWVTILSFSGLFFALLVDQKNRLIGAVLRGMNSFRHSELLLVVLLWVGFVVAYGATPWRVNSERKLQQAMLFLEDLEPLSAKQDWGTLQKKVNVSKNPIKIRGKKFTHGLGTHAQSTIRYSIPKNVHGFYAEVGIDDASDGGRVRFIVLVDGKEIWKSSILSNASPIQFCNIVFPDSAKRMTLIVDKEGDNFADHSDWGDAAFISELDTMTPFWECG